MRFHARTLRSCSLVLAREEYSLMRGQHLARQRGGLAMWACEERWRLSGTE